MSGDNDATVRGIPNQIPLTVESIRVLQMMIDAGINASDGELAVSKLERLGKPRAYRIKPEADPVATRADGLMPPMSPMLDDTSSSCGTSDEPKLHCEMPNTK